MSLLAGLRERRARGELAVDLEAARARVAALENVATTMLGCVRSLVLDIDELGAHDIKTRLAQLTTQLRQGAEASEISETCAQQRSEILEFAERERDYLDRRDAELRRIIEVLSHGLAGVSQGAATYHRRLLDNGTRLEAASRLSDLVKMRAAITAEVHGLRTAIAERQVEEQTQAQALRREVEQLRQNVARAQTEARTDPLTGAANRAAFDEELARRCELAAAGREGFALVFADIDHFKRINDSYGHPVGDRVLTAFVEFLRARIRRSDTLARYGGEEFGVILPGAALRPALRKARRMNEELARSDWAVDLATKLKFTASMGVAAWQPGEGASGLVERVDRALYRAKHEGRNRVVKA
ncbi:MAG: diguanylate cyclase [Deltaproteobacteria bacterium]|nr:MAG: diguanylate cyclase [Deltaproteobacteria bacterium]TMQ04608.1 MAG: diguanylate cyclase [Deltaproteobacteria bacterium]